MVITVTLHSIVAARAKYCEAPETTWSTTPPDQPSDSA